MRQWIQLSVCFCGAEKHHSREVAADKVRSAAVLAMHLLALSPNPNLYSDSLTLTLTLTPTLTLTLTLSSNTSPISNKNS